MTEDFRPTCFWCTKPLNTKERKHHEKRNDFLCKKCFKEWKTITSNAGIETHLEEDY